MALPPPHPSLVAAFEQACNDAQVPTTRAAAEQTLASLTSHPDSVSLTFAVLQSSSSPVARFHAAKALQSAANERWQSLSPQLRYNQSSLRHSLINLVISKPQFQPFDRTAILRTVAFLTRRAYLEEDLQSRNDFFSLLCQSACSPHSPPYTSFIAIHLIDLIIDEFVATSLSFSNSSSIHREMFVRARQVFSSSQGHLLPFFTASVRLLTLLTNSVPSQSYSSVSFSTRAIPALSVIHRVFTTDFRSAPLPPTPDYSSSLDDPNSNSFSTDALETVVINTFNTPDWQPLMSQISLVLDISFSIIAALIVLPDPDLNSDSDLISNPLHIITAISAISHGSFPSPQSASHTLSVILTGLNQQQWSVSVLGPVRLAYAEVWRRVSCAHGLNNVERQPSNFILIFTNDTCRQMDALSVKTSTSDPDDDEFSMDVIDLLLETWANLALQADDGSTMSEHPLSVSIEQVIIHFMNMSLSTFPNISSNPLASTSPVAPDIEEDLGLDDSSVDDSRLSVAAILTRFILDKIVDDLSRSLTQAADKVFNWPRGHSSYNGLPFDLYQEDLYFLIQLTCAVLTDEAKGEYPSVPTQFLTPQDPGNHFPIKTRTHARTLLSTVFDVAEKESRLLIERGVHCVEASPRVGSALLSGLGRIARTYLVPLNSSNEGATFAAAGGQSLVESGRNCCFIKVVEGLTQRGFEGDIADAAASLMSSLALASQTHRALIEAPVWQQLLRAGVGAFQTLPPKAVRDVGRSLTLVLGDVVVEQLLIPAYTCLQTLSRSHEYMADAADRVIATLNLVCGTASCYGMGTRTRQTLIACLKTPDGVAATCAKNFGHTRPDVSRTVLRLADDILYSSLAVIDENEGRDLLRNLMTLLKIHSDIICTHMADLTLDELGTNAEDVLMLLTHMLDEEGEADVAEACFYGLSTLLPAMNERVLEIPSVNSCFFRFVALLVCSHAEKLTYISPDLCAKILQSIDIQRASFDATSERKALEAITALARARVAARHHQDHNQNHHDNHNHNQNHLDPKNPYLSSSDIVDTTSMDSVSTIVDSALRQFLLRIFEAIANGSAHTTNLDAAADALLPLAHVQIDIGDGKSISAFEQVGSALVSSTGNNADLRGAVVQLAHVASEAGLAYGFHDGVSNRTDRAAILRATKQFREAVANFSAEARNCLVSVAIAGTSPS